MVELQNDVGPVEIIIISMSTEICQAVAFYYFNEMFPQCDCAMSIVLRRDES